MIRLPTILLLTGSLILAGCGERTAPPAPVIELGTQPDSPTGAILAAKGETLYSISKRYNLPLQDIIRLNNIAPPYELNAGQRLKLPAPRYYSVRPQDSLYQISRMFDVSVTDIARTNNLSAPYTLTPGQKLRMPLDAPQRASRQASVSQPSSGKQSEYQSSSRASAPQQAKPKTRSQAPARKTTSSSTAAGTFTWPVQGRIISDFGPKENGLHNDGLNIAAPLGTSVRAANDGTVVYVGNALESFGNLVIVRHSNGWVTAYAHLDKVRVQRGQAITQNNILGTVGSTGRVDAPQLHFEIRRGSEALNPQKYLVKS